MNQPLPEHPPVLENAWKRYADMDALSLKLGKQHMTLRRWIAILGVLATLFAILVNEYIVNADLFYPLIENIFRWVLIMTPLAASVIAAYTNKKYSTGTWLILRAAAEEVLKEIYFYRTVLRSLPDRDKRLTNRLVTIQRQLYSGLGGQLVIKPYTGSIPPYYNPNYPNSDPGFFDIGPEEYLTLRLENQLNWHNKKLLQYDKERNRLIIYVLLAGFAGAVLAAAGNQFTVWVALTASISAALIGWEELRNLEMMIGNYSKVVLELTIYRDRWLSLRPEEQTTEEFFKMVRDTETLLWMQNQEFIKNMQESLMNLRAEESELIDRMLRMEPKTMKNMQNMLASNAEAALEEAHAKLSETGERAMLQLQDSIATGTMFVMGPAPQTATLEPEVLPQDEVFEPQEEVFDDSPPVQKAPAAPPVAPEISESVVETQAVSKPKKKVEPAKETAPKTDETLVIPKETKSPSANKDEFEDEIFDSEANPSGVEEIFGDKIRRGKKLSDNSVMLE